MVDWRPLALNCTFKCFCFGRFHDVIGNQFQYCYKSKQHIRTVDGIQFLIFYVIGTKGTKALLIFNDVCNHSHVFVYKLIEQ